MSQNQKPVLTPIDTALDMLLAQLPQVCEQETLPLEQASGRALAEDYVSSAHVPPHASSAMDGYALRTSDLDGESASLKITQRIAAGEVGSPLGVGEAARIFTGAPIPEGADAVAMQENCSVAEGQLTLKKPVVGENVRQAGDDILSGAMVLAKGCRLRPQDLGLLASIGVEKVKVKRKLRVTLLTTGNELVRPGTRLKAGQIYNSNYYTLYSLLESLHVDVLDGGIVEDDFEETSKALLAAATVSDCIISTGGVSVGEEDHVKAAVEKEGVLDLWKLAIKPGKPLACGKIGDCQFFGLPGNPVSAFITFALVVRPCLLTMLGCEQVGPQTYKLAAGFKSSISGERQEYLRANLVNDEQGNVALMPLSNQGSGVATSLNQSDGLVIIPPYTSIAIGDNLTFIPFSEILN
jgi:molybdopterin molybdotransferase